MSTDAIVAYALIALPAALSLFVSGVGIHVVIHNLRRWHSGAEPSIPGSMWQALLFVVVLDVILFAGMNVGQFFVLWTEGWSGIVAVIATVFMPWLGFKAASLKFQGGKGGGVDIGNGGNE